MSELLKDAELVKEKLNIHYRIIMLDLTKSRNNEEFDLEKLVTVYQEIKILYAPSDFSFRLNDKTNDLINIRANDLTQLLNLKFDKIFFTNDEDTGIAEIYITSRED